MKILEMIFWIVLTNKLKLFFWKNLSNITNWYKNIYKNWKDYEKLSLFIIPIMNIFLFYWIINFIIVICIDYIFYKYLQKKAS